MKITKNFYIGLAFAGFFVFLFLMFGLLAQQVNSAANVPAPSQQYNLPVTLLAATTTSATSTNLTAGGGGTVIAGAKKVVVYFQRGGVANLNLGTSTFKVQVSPDGVVWNDFGLFKSATSTTAIWPAIPTVFTNTTNNYIVLGTGTGNGTTTIPLALDLTNFGFYSMRVIVVEDVDGEHTVKAAITY